MSRSWNSINKTLRSIQSAIYYAFERAAKDHWTHLQLLDWKSKEVFGRPDYPTLPRWTHSEIAGVWWAFNEIVWREKLVFTYLHNGKRFGLGTPEYRAIDVFEIKTETGAYSWKDDLYALFTEPGAGQKKKEETPNES